MNNRLLVPRKTPGLLDLVPGAAAAYSLRSLSRSYAGPVVTVRRSSDDAEDDFTAAEVADGTLAAFCGAGDGFVKQWWDQSGNAKHGVAAADANEPKIVDSGVVILEEGKPAIQFDGSDDFLSADTLATVFTGEDKPVSAFFVLKIAATEGRDVFGFYSSTSNTPVLRPFSMGSGASANRFQVFNRDAASVNVNHIFGTIGTQQQHIASISNGTLQSLYQNAVAIASSLDIDVGDIAVDLCTIGATSQSGTEARFFSGTTSELVIYADAKTDLLDLITGNQMWYY